MAIISVSGKIGSGKDTVTSIIQYLTHCPNDNSTKEFIRRYNDGSIYKPNYNWKNVKWADTLKDCVCLILNCTREQLEDREFKETTLGEEWIRYGYANGFTQSNGKTTMNNEPCSKERYEEELRTNWQTAYKLEHSPRSILQLLGTQCGRFVHPNIWVNSLMNKYDYLVRWKEQGSDCVIPNWIISDTRFPNEADAVKARGGINIRLQRNSNIESSNQHESETALDDYSFDYVIDNNGTIEELIDKVKEILIKENII